MTKHLIRVECDTIRVFKVKKGPRQMVSVGSRLYRMDDDLMVKDTKTSDCAAIYDVDSTQPYLPYFFSSFFCVAVDCNQD